MDGMYYPEESLLVQAAESVWNGSKASINIGIEVGEKLIEWMSSYLPNKLESGFITDSDMRHIMRSHGDKEERGQ